MQNRFVLTPFYFDEPLPRLESLAEPGWRINKPDLPNGDSQPPMSVIHQALAEFVASTAANGDRPVSITGDCCTAIGVLAGLQRAGVSPVLLWLDAHGDFNTRETSPSGFLGGMPLAMIVGRGEQTLMEAVELHPIPEQRVILTDARDLDPKEKLALAASEVIHLPDSRLLLDHPLTSQTLYIHFDPDFITPNDAPAMNYAAPGGLPASELKDMLRELARRTQIIAVSMTTWNPKMDADGRSQETCMKLLHALLEE